MVYILLGEGFEEIEALATCDVLRRGDAEVRLVGLTGMAVTGAHGITVQADLTADRMDLSAMEMIVLPGGMGGVRSILACENALRAVRFAAENGRKVAAICAAPTVLASLGLLDGKKAVCYPGMEAQLKNAVFTDVPVVRDGSVTCGRAPGASIAFGLALLEQLRGKETAETVRRGLVVDA